LVVNARDAMPDGGRLAIATTSLDPATATRLSAFVPASSFVALTVTDTGEGMDEETQRRAFEPFFTTKAKGKGTGLGLSTVYGVVKRSGGYVAIESARGRGTTFHVLFPPAGEATSFQVAPGAPGRRGEETILLVEDEEPVRRLLAQGLSSAGFRVLAAGSVD